MKFMPVDEIRPLLSGIADEMGFELVDVVYDPKDNTLTAFIDKEGGMDMDSCVLYHNAISDPLDELNPSYDAPYTLNVSSPGLDRPFKTRRDFERNIGEDVEIRLYAPYRGSKSLEGVLLSFDENTVTVRLGKEETRLQMNKIAKINKAIKFDF